ncbi:hypothetical protein ACFYXH_05470 [Streptomyces sp. NPDC002730]|uniref:hypothetical protein n=1 Tax=Streptomyces sp. NPDC002730 TaxID=3364662 RepID=UPI00369C880C
MTLVAGLIVLALLLLLSMCGGGEGAGKAADDKTGKPVRHSAGPLTRLTVPSAYDTRQDWEISNVSPEYAIAQDSGRIGYLERVDESRFRLRTLDSATGRPGWTGQPWHPPASADQFPGLLSVAKDGREYFVTWSFGTAGEDALNTAGTFVALDVTTSRTAVGSGSRSRGPPHRPSRAPAPAFSSPTAAPGTRSSTRSPAR